ncbi:enolase C-terminal domain-like protein [Clostridiaceae bacterium HSG29]|nr:enolase C-terminal domain-like protein [Clostridiaceae bacterium HSG29]
MKIQKIDVFHLKIKLAKPYKLSKLYGTLEDTEPIVVKITTDTGIVGFGETDPMGLFTGETAETVIEVIKKYIGPAVIGADPLNIATIHKLMDGKIKDMHVAKAAIDIAVYDIIGKHLGVSVSNLLGGTLTKSLPIMGSIGGGTPEENAIEAQNMIEMGYGSIMIKIGGDVHLDIERTKAIRKKVGEKFVLIVDANQGWDASTAIYYSKQVEDCNIDLFEQPVPFWDIQGLKKVRMNTNMKISADESLMSIHEAKRLILEEAVDVFSIKVSKNGGIYRSKEIISLANSFGIECLFNSMIEEGITQAASYALGSSTDNLYPYGHAYFSPLRLEDDITNYSKKIVNGKIMIDEAKGLGIEVDEKKLEKYCINYISI